MDFEFNRHEICHDEFYRKESYDFFSSFEVGYYSLSTEICVDGIMQYIHKYKESFYCIMTYIILKTCNNIENFCYRKVDNKIYLYHNIAASCTILKQNKNIEFTNHIYYKEDLGAFTKHFHNKKIEAINGKTYSDLRESYDLIYITAMPWFRLKSMNNVRVRLEDDTIPRFSWGKYFQRSNKTYVDISIEISHAFIDGYHIHLLISEIEKLIEKLKNI